MRDGAAKTGSGAATTPHQCSARFVAGVGTIFLALRTRLRRLEPNGKKVVYEHSNVQ
jgi:hypothetical protein